MLHALPSYDNSPSDADIQSTARIYAQSWVDALGGTVRPFYVNRIATWLRQGFDPDLIDAAMIATFEAPLPSWRYLEAIISRCLAERCFTAYEFINRRPPPRY